MSIIAIDAPYVHGSSATVLLAAGLEHAVPVGGRRIGRKARCGPGRALPFRQSESGRVLLVKIVELAASPQSCAKWLPAWRGAHFQNTESGDERTVSSPSSTCTVSA